MKKLIRFSLIAALSTMAFGSEADLKAEIEALKKEVEALKKAQAKINISALKRQISEIKAKTGGDNLKWNVDFRTANDFIDYKYANGDRDANGILSNRLWLGMAYAPKDYIVFKGLVGYYKEFGQLPAPSQGFNYMDWIVNETPNPSGELRVKEAYWLYFGDDFLGLGLPWTASAGRRPATDGLLISYREDQIPKSPLGHIINTEFDGASIGITLEDAVDIPGFYVKLCMGRGMSNTAVRYGAIRQQGNDFNVTSSSGEYTKVPNWKDTDLFGIIFKPYDDGQYSVTTTLFKAWHLPGLDGAADGNVTNNVYGFRQLGDLYGAAISVLAQGIGDGINDTLDDTNAFVSLAWSKTDPKAGNRMLGSADEESGTSVYVGVNWPCLVVEDARVGLEYNHGSKYWRSFTYGEDTLAGSKMAVRGDAYEVWFTKKLIGDIFSAQLRYTYIDYDYTGSQGFFGDGGTPMKIKDAINFNQNPVDKAQDLRVYLKYRY